MINLYFVRLRMSSVSLMVVLGFPVRLVHVGRIDLQTLPLGSQLPEDTLWPEGANVPFLQSRALMYFSQFYPIIFYNGCPIEEKCQISLLLDHSAKTIQSPTMKQP